MFNKVLLTVASMVMLIGTCIVANAATTTFVVDAKYSDRYLLGYPHTGFQATGVYLQAGDRLTIVSSGLSCVVPGGCSGPNGGGSLPPPSIAPSFLAPDLIAAALVGKIGSNKSFFVGESFDSIVTIGGELYLGFNDSRCDDNSGAFYAQISVTRTPSNTPPEADAGPDQAVNEFALVALNGSASKDADGDPLVFQWTQVGGTPVVLDMADPARPIFTAPLVSQGGETLTFQLVVNDGKLSSTPDIVNISIKNINYPPVADAGPDMIVGEKTQVTLDGSFSYDGDGDPITYNWLQTAGPVVELSDPVAAKPAFSAPTVGLDGATLTFQLEVSDGIDSISDTVQVFVENVNHPPVVDAGTDQLRNEGGNVFLNGASSSDIDGDALSYTWKQLEGIPVELSDDHGQSPSFIAPLVGPEGASLLFQLIVSDGLIDSAPALVKVSVLDINSPPSCGTAKANPYILWPPNHKLVPVGIAGVKDAENDQVTITLLGVTQNEPVKGLGDGDSGPDAVIEGNALLLRAERAGDGNGRTYRATFRADDSFGENCIGTFTVIVPHARNGSSIDEGTQHDSLQP